MKNCILKIIRIKRLEKNYSQEYMSSQLDLTQSSYGRIENGKTPLTLEMLQNILVLLEIDFFYFFNIVKIYKDKNTII